MSPKNGLKVLDQVIRHFEQQGTLTILVPEWGNEDEPLQIHVSPYTMDEQKKLRVRNKGDLDDPSVLVDLLILKAEDGQGNKLFDLGDKPQLLRKADANVLARVAAEITSADALEDISKN